MRRLAVLDALLDLLNVIFYMPIGDEDVGTTVQVVIKEEAGEAQREQAGVADFRTRRLIHKKAIALIVIERHHLVGEIRDDDAWASRPIIVPGIHSHACTCNAIFTEGDPCLHTLFRKGTVVVVDVELVGLRIVGQQQVGPAISIGIKRCYAQSFGSWIIQSGFTGHIFKLAAALVVPEPGGYSRI